jgi:transcriptional regulator with XRE-family HTH domain
MKFGDYLRQKREEKNWTQPEASNAAGIEQSYLSKLETGKSWPSEDVFARLTTAYGIDVDDMVRQVGSSELSRLKEIGAVRTAILSIDNGQRRVSRGWLIASLLCLIASAACLGLTQMARDTDKVEWQYRSMGILKPGEPLEAFNVVSEQLDPRLPNYAERDAQRQAMIPRINEARIATFEQRPESFIEPVDGGLRYYSASGMRPIEIRSPLRWFIVPALMFFAGFVGCAFISFRWR